MWYWLYQLETAFFLPPFLIYARLRGIYCSTTCTKCGKRLLNYEHCKEGLCDECIRREALSNPAWLHGRRGDINKTTIAKGLWCGEGHIYKTVTNEIGRGKVIDVGCGSGALLFMLDPKDRQLYGVDIVKGIIGKAGARTKNTNFSIGDARNIPFKSDAFDYLICAEVLEHIEGDDAIKECYRVLKPNGIALFTVPNGEGVSGKVPEHVRLFSFQSFSSFLRQQGFQIISSSKFGLYIFGLHRVFGMLSSVLGKNLSLAHSLNVSVPECLAINFLIKCRKPIQ